MRKIMFNGFTLSEALIVMSILGVVAALTIPQVGYSIQKSKNAAVLSRTVEHMETGCQNMLDYYNKELESRADYDFAGSEYTGFSSIPFSDGGETGFLMNKFIFNYGTNSEFFGLGDKITTGDSRLNGYTPKTYNKTGNIQNVMGMYDEDALYASSSTGAFVGIGALSGNGDEGLINREGNSKNDPVVNLIYIDTNAEAKPNELGKDIFIFGLTDKCKMEPAGSVRMRAMGIPSGDSNGCNDGNVTNGGLGCADRVVKDGYKIDY